MVWDSTPEDFPGCLLLLIMDGFCPCCCHNGDPAEQATVLEGVGCFLVALLFGCSSDALGSIHRPVTFLWPRRADRGLLKEKVEL